ncbi:MAG: tetratricopeptide repeat protein [Planctomycetes bacterium]|nr:tetratricopeptide repeat protein [Planctomycetota bacterium]
MTTRLGPTALAWLWVAVVLVAGPGCGDAPSDEPIQPKKSRVEELDLPTDAERESSDKLAEAETFMLAKKTKLAEVPLRRVLELSPHSGRAAELLAQCLIERGAVHEAIPLLRTAIEGAPRRAALRALLIQSLMHAGDAAVTEVAAREWTDVDAANADAWFELGRASYLQGKNDDAIAAFRRAELLKASRADIRSELGLALVAAGQLGKAEAKFRDAIDRQPDYADAWFRLGDVIFRRDPARAGEAAEALARAVEIEPGHVLGHLYLFRVCRLATTKSNAPADDPLRLRGEEAWKAVLRIHGRAQAAAVLGADATPSESTSEFALREQVSLHPEDVSHRIALGKFLHAERRYDDAIDTWRKAIDAGASDAWTRTRLAVALVARNDSVAADAELRAALLDAPREVMVHRLLAWTLLLRGRDDDAILVATAALDCAPGDVLARKIRALAKMHKGDVDASLQEIAALGWL